jgi:hypothetical protein
MGNFQTKAGILQQSFIMLVISLCWKLDIVQILCMLVIATSCPGDYINVVADNSLEIYRFRFHEETISCLAYTGWSGASAQCLQDGSCLRQSNL